MHAILDDSEPDILEELAQAVADGPGAERHIHLVLENDHNAAHYLRRGSDGQPLAYAAQWNDDIHHALHVLTTGDTGGYYMDYADNPIHHLGRCLTEGFAYQGEASPYRHGARRGESTRDIPPTAFVSFLQNHDQIGNRAFGERITALAPPSAVRAASAIMLLAPSPPLLFMGQEWGTERPFLFFCDLGPDLAKAVTEGRRQEFARFAQFSDPVARARIPDPNDIATYHNAVLDWAELQNESHAQWLTLHRALLRTRQQYIVPRLVGMQPDDTRFELLSGRALQAQWLLGDRSRLILLANLDSLPVKIPGMPAGQLLYPFDVRTPDALADGVLAPWSVVWVLDASS